MNNQDLRKVLLKVGDRLSDQSRKRLHFLLADNVTRPIQDNTTIHGTLDLWQSLFDQGKINENDVTLLISAFRDIGCMDAAKDLQSMMSTSMVTLMLDILFRIYAVSPIEWSCDGVDRNSHNTNDCEV